MFNIRIKVKGYLENLTENTKEIINTQALKKSNVISYIIDNNKYKIIIDNKKITQCRESDEYSHVMFFEETKKHTTEYYLKGSNYSLEFTILTTKLIIEKNKIHKTYKIIESENIYNYVLEMSENL